MHVWYLFSTRERSRRRAARRVRLGELQWATDARAFVDGGTVELPDMQFLLLESVIDYVRDVSRGRRKSRLKLSLREARARLRR